MFAEPIPENAERAGALSIDRYERGGALYCRIWRGKQSKPYAHYKFRNPEEREKWVEHEKLMQAESEKLRAEQSAKRKAEADKAAETFRVGTILYTSWGYDQTNVDYYQIVRKQGRAVWLRPIDGWVAGDSIGSDRVAPDVGNFKGPETRHVINGNYIRVGHQYAHECQPGETHHQTAIGWGH